MLKRNANYKIISTIQLVTDLQKLFLYKIELQVSLLEYVTKSQSQSHYTNNIPKRKVHYAK